MATVKTRTGSSGNTYEVRWKDPEGRSQTRTFKKKGLATQFAVEVEAAKIQGTYVDHRKPAPVVQVHTVGSLAQTVLDSKPDPNTLAWYGYMLSHVRKRWDVIEVADVNFLDVQAWVTAMTKAGIGAPTVRGAFVVFHEIIKIALAARLIAHDPCVGIKKPRISRKEMLYLNKVQVELLADAMEEDWPGFGWGTLIQFAAYSGCRAGEIGGLRVKHLDLLHRRVRIVVARKTYGTDGETKTGKSRWVRLPRQLCVELANHIGDRGPEERVWTGDRGGPLDHHWFYERRYKPVVRKLSALGYLPVIVDEDDPEAVPRTLRFHDLRHTCVALLIAKGKQEYHIMKHLGHSSIKTTIDTYGHMFPDVEEQIGDALEETWEEAQVGAKAVREQHLSVVGATSG